MFNNIHWIEVNRYCYPWHGEYNICCRKVEQAMQWITENLKPSTVYYKYPEEASNKDSRYSFLPTHIGFKNKKDAVFFKLSCEI